MNKLSQNLLIAGGVVVVALLAWRFSAIVAYILVSAILALVGRPIVNALSLLKVGGRRAPRWFCAAVGLVAIMAVIFAFFRFFIPLIAVQMQELATVNPDELVKLLTMPFVETETLVNRIFPATGFSFDALVADKLTSVFGSSFLFDFFGSVTNLVVSITMGIFIVSFITFFFMKEENLFIDGVTVLFPERYENGIRNGWNNATRLLMRYFIGVFFDMLCVTTALTLGLHFVGGLSFGASALIGLIAGILNVIPYVGPLIAAATGIVIAIASKISVMQPHDYPGMMLKLLVIFVAMKLLDDIVFQPYIFANSVKAHPLEIFLLIIAAGSLAGIGGMLIAIPAYTVLRVFAKEFFNEFRVVQKLTQRI
jgi:predicted PurR-regulated permease PerM